MDLKSIPTWGWVAGGGAVLVGAFALTSKKAASQDTGQSSGFGDMLQGIMDSLAQLQQDIVNPPAPGTNTPDAQPPPGGGGPPNPTPNPNPNPSPNPNPNPIITPMPTYSSVGSITGTKMAAPILRATQVAGFVNVNSPAGTTRISSGQYAGKIVPVTDVSKTPSPGAGASPLVAGYVSASPKKPAPVTTTKIITGRYAGKTVPIQ